MAAYKDLVGQKITKVTSNPGEPKTGQMWYNSTSGSLKGLGVVEAFSSASPLTTGRFNSGAGGTASATWIAGGYEPSASNKTEEFNGSGFSNGGNLNTARGGNIGTGIQTAGLTMGGGPGSSPYTSAATEEYDGSSWTNISPGLNTERLYAGAGGTQTAGVVFAGSTTPNATVRSSATEEYNGSSWTTVSGGNVNSAQSHLGGCGTQTAALKAGGDDPGGSSNNSEEYNGSTWTTGNNLNTARRADGTSGIQTQALVVGGFAPPGAKSVVESYDGTSFTETVDLATAQYYNTTSGNTNGTGILSMGGTNPSVVTTVEEYNKTTNSITAAAWASGGSLNQGRINVSMGGTQTAGIVLGGHQSPGAEPAAVETYNGSSFTSGTAIGPYTGDYAAYAGSQTQGIIFGGAPYTTNTAEYDGEWAAGGSLSQGRSDLMGAGTGETSAVAIGGFSPAPTARAETEEYGGTSWTSGGSLSTGRGQGAGFGIETAALITGGEVSGGTKQSATEEYNGSSWTSGGSLITATGDYIGGWGTQTSGVVVGGATTDYVTTTLEYDGTSFTTRPNAANPAGRTQTAGANSAAGLRAGGGPNTTQRDGSEEFTGETTAANIENFNTSV